MQQQIDSINEAHQRFQRQMNEKVLQMDITLNDILDRPPGETVTTRTERDDKGRILFHKQEFSTPKNEICTKINKMVSAIVLDHRMKLELLLTSHLRIFSLRLLPQGLTTSPKHEHEDELKPRIELSGAISRRGNNWRKEHSRNKSTRSGKNTVWYDIY